MTAIRKSQKAATRQRVLHAARDLFESRGYENTTVREIARQAEVSVGSVFTAFASKAELLNHVMADWRDALYAELDRVAPQLRGSPRDSLRALFAIHYALETGRPHPLLAQVARGQDPRLRILVRGCLERGLVNGEIGLAHDLDLVIDALIASYAWSCQLVIHDDGAGDMNVMMDKHIGLIINGCRG
jgi:AcrR family transcriptional regulator